MAYLRSALRWFATANPAYTSASVAVYEVDPETREVTGRLAALYDAPAGSGQIPNPQTLDSAGKFPVPVYVEAPCVAVVNSNTVGTHQTGVFAPDSGSYRGDWLTGTLYWPDDVVRIADAGPLEGNLYACRAYHTAGVFAEDLAAGEWLLTLNVAPVRDAVATTEAQMLAAQAAQDAAEAAEADVIARHADIVTRNDDIITRQQNVADRQLDVTNRQSDVAGMQADVINRQADVHTQQDDITAQHGDITTRHANIISRHDDIIAKNANVVSLHDDTVTRHGDIVTRHGDITTQHADVTTKHDTVVQKAAQVATDAQAANASKQAAATSETNAAGSATAAANTLTDFLGRYIAQPTAPSAPDPGDLWFDKTSNRMKVWNGVDWQLTGNGQALNPTGIKTAAYNIAAGELVRFSSTAGAFTLTLPGAPQDGDIVAILDVGGAAGTNAVTLARNGKKIAGLAEDLIVDYANIYVPLQYVASTGDWRLLDNPAAGALIPSQVGKAGLLLTTDGTAPAWSSGVAVGFGSLELTSAAPFIKFTETDDANNFFNVVIDASTFSVRRNNVWPGPLQLTSNGRVGINTGTPGAELEVADIAGDNDVRINLRASASILGQIGRSTTAMFVDTQNAHPFQVFGNGAEQVRVTPVASAARVLDLRGAIAGNDPTIGTTGGGVRFTVPVRGDYVTLADAGTITPDFSLSNRFIVTLGGNRILGNPSSMPIGQSGVIIVRQDGTGSRTLSYGSFWKFIFRTIPTLTTTANAVDRLQYEVISATEIHVSLLPDFA